MRSGNLDNFTEGLDGDGDGLLEFQEFAVLNVTFPLVFYPAFRMQVRFCDSFACRCANARLPPCLPRRLLVPGGATAPRPSGSPTLSRSIAFASPGVATRGQDSVQKRTLGMGKWNRKRDAWTRREKERAHLVEEDPTPMYDQLDELRKW